MYTVQLAGKEWCNRMSFQHYLVSTDVDDTFTPDERHVGLSSRLVLLDAGQ